MLFIRSTLKLVSKSLILRQCFSQMEQYVQMALHARMQQQTRGQPNLSVDELRRLCVET